MTAPTVVRDERGVALATAVTVVTIVFMMLAAVVLPVVADVDTARRSMRLTENRALGESVLNELFAEITSKPDADPVLAGRVSPGVQVSMAGPTAGWAAWDLANDRAVVCPVVSSACFYYAVRPPSATGPFVAAEAAADYALAEVTVRTGCTRSGTKCVLRRYQQRWKRRRLLDYTLFTDYETLKPSLYPPTDVAFATGSCSQPADVGVLASPPNQKPTGGLYRDGSCLDHVAVGLGEGPRDRIVGPVHTNDTQIWVCGSPVFTGRVEASGPQPVTAFPADGCVDGATAPMTAQVAPIPLPTSVTPFAEITPLAYRITGPVEIDLDGPAMRVRSATADRTMGVPTRGIVYVVGSLSVHGAGRDVTFVATGDVTISSDLVSDRTSTDNSNIGVIAGRDIVIGGDGGGDLTVHASLLAANGTVYSARHDGDGGGDHTLTLRGAVVARYHPAIGIYDRTTGALLSGLVTDLAYPSAAPNPPYFLEPVRAQWERIDLTEITMSDNDLTDGITPAPLRGLPPMNTSCLGAAPAPYDGTYLRGCLRSG